MTVHTRIRQLSHSTSIRTALTLLTATGITTSFSSSLTSYDDLKNGSSRSSSSVKCESMTSIRTDKEIHTKNVPSSKPGVKLLFLGSGSSTGCPNPLCSLIFPEENHNNVTMNKSNQSLMKMQRDMANGCKISKLASMGDPKMNRNYRNNPSLLISHRNSDATDMNDKLKSHLSSSASLSPDLQLKNVVIDVGKTFREGAIRWMPKHGIYSVDGVVITHEHADAMLGLDDLRGFQRKFFSKQMYGDDPPLPIHLSSKCFENIKRQFKYLIPKHLMDIDMKVKDDNVKDNDSDTRKRVPRNVAKLDFEVVEFFKPFIVAGLKMIPLPVIHGEDFICNGYSFTVNGETKDNVHVVYLSDLSRMLPETEKFIQEKLPPIDILVVDSLLYNRSHPVHFGLDQALDLVSRLDPQKAYLVGMSCDSFPEHFEANTAIQKRNPKVELAYDGLAIEL